MIGENQTLRETELLGFSDILLEEDSTLLFPG